MKLLKLGNVCLDGTKVQANASRHSALSHGLIEKLETQLKAEVQELLALAEKTDQADVPNGIDLPAEIRRREDRLAAMAETKAKITARTEERYQREKAEYNAKLEKRAEKEKSTGNKPGGKPPAAPSRGPKDNDQINLTDEESRIMLVSGGGFEQAYNAQAAVDTESMLVVATGLIQAPNDKEQVKPMLETLAAQTQRLGQVTGLIADTGFYSETNITTCEAAGVAPRIAVAKEDHHSDWRERHSEPQPPPENATPLQAMAHRLKTKAGRALYALRKQTWNRSSGSSSRSWGFVSSRYAA